MMESQLQDRSVRKHICSWTHCVMDQWSRDGWIKNTILWRRNQLKQIFPDFEMLDAGIASALRKNCLQNLMHKKSQCWRAASSEEQRNSWEGGKLLIWSMATFSQPELMMKLKACQICSIFAYMTMTFRISIQDGTKFRWQQVRYLKRMFLKFCTRRSYRDLKNFQLFWQCTTDNSVEMENRQAIKDWGRWLDNILIRWSGRATSKPGMKEFRQEFWFFFFFTSHKGRKVSVDRKVGESCQWKATGQYSKRDSCSFSHGSNRGQKAQSSSPAPKSADTDWRKKTVERFWSQRRESFWIERSESVDRTHSQYTSVQYCLFTSAERTPHAWLKSHGLHCHLCAPEKNLSSGVAHVSSLVYSPAVYHEHVIFLIHTSFYDTRTRSTIGATRATVLRTTSTSCTSPSSLSRQAAPSRITLAWKLQSGGNPRTTAPTGYEPKELAVVSRIEDYSGDPYQ